MIDLSSIMIMVLNISSWQINANYYNHNKEHFELPVMIRAKQMCYTIPNDGEPVE